MAAELGALLVTVLAAVVIDDGTGIVVELFALNDAGGGWLLVGVVATVVDKDDDVAGGTCDSFKCLPRTMSDTVGRLPPSSTPEVM